MGRPGLRAATRLLALPLLCLLFTRCTAFRRADWTLPAGFNVEPYSPGDMPMPNARSLALSQASRPNGPWITFVSSMSFGGAPKSVSADGSHQPD